MGAKVPSVGMKVQRNEKSRYRFEWHAIIRLFIFVTSLILFSIGLGSESHVLGRLGSVIQVSASFQIIPAPWVG